MAEATFAGLLLDRPIIMGVVNVTPDSFSDGGETLDAAAAVARGRQHIKAGARILDIGAESTRPGADPVSPQDEINRARPVIEALAGGGAVISVDTRKAEVMAAALKAGASIINDIAALTDPGALDAAANGGASVILMHMQGDPATMQDAPAYRDAPKEIRAFLAARIEACQAAGIDKARIAIDPGIGFGKTPRHNVEIVSRLDEFLDLGCPLVLGVSRKSFIASLSRDAPPRMRLGGSLAAALAGVKRGAKILRVHDVAETRQALDVWEAMENEL